MMTLLLSDLAICVSIRKPNDLNAGFIASSVLNFRRTAQPSST